MSAANENLNSTTSVWSNLGRRLTAAICLPVMAIFLGGAAPVQQQGQIRIPHERIQFEFGDSAGEWVYPCKHHWLDHAENWAVTCADPEGRGATWNFTVHFRLFAFTRLTSPKLSYQVLYLVTDQQRPPGGQGKYNGSTVWFRLDEPSALTELDLGQDIQDTYTLRARVKVPGPEAGRTAPSDHGHKH